jgi:NADPH2:quinone reductase
MRAWQLNELGLPWEVLQPAAVSMPMPDPDRLHVRVLAADLNFADILQCQGRYQVKLEPPFVPGMYAVGEVLSASNPEFQPGDRVIGPTVDGCGAFAEEAMLLAEQATPLPATADPVKVCAMHVTYGTAWFGLHLRGQLKAGETVLVLAAAGGVGSAAVELAKHHGCWVVAAAGGQAKVQACRDLGADEVIDYNSEDLYERVMEMTDGRGVDVVYDPVGGEYFETARRLVAWEGRLLVIGFASGDIPSAPLNHMLVKNYSVVGVHMGGYWSRNPEPFRQCYAELSALLEAGSISPLIDTVIGFDKLPDALNRLNNRETVGRVVMTPQPQVPAGTG